MIGNSILNKTKYSSKNTDEWFTTYETIDEEVTNYVDCFCGKTVLCNCDNPFESNFCYFFLKNFKYLKLKKLICTSYVGAYDNFNKIKNNYSLKLEHGNDLASSGRGYLLIINSVPCNSGEQLDDFLIKDILNKEGNVRYLEGDGDFRSDECLRYLKECDICCTNPPFSLFRDLFSLLVKFKKKYLIIGNQNALTYKEIFPFIKSNMAWVGHKFGDMSFHVPSDTKPRKTRFWIDENGQKWRSIGNAMWLTNLDTERRHLKLLLTKKYDPKNYPKYDDYDCIHVQKVADIPYDYDGIMGVPITYIKYHNLSQFEIIGEANHGSDNEFDLFKPRLNGKDVFKRILIRRVNKEDEF